MPLLLSGGWRTLSHFYLDDLSQLDDTTAVRQRRGTGLAFPGSIKGDVRKLRLRSWRMKCFFLTPAKFNLRNADVRVISR